MSRDGARFAIATERWGFGDPAYINKESVVAYETSSVRPVMTIESEHPPSLQSASALSPNGNAIAIGAGSGISYFRVP